MFNVTINGKNGKKQDVHYKYLLVKSKIQQTAWWYAPLYH